MADDGAKSAAGTEVPDVSPGAGFQVFVEMANLYNKLKLLNYDDEYVIKWRMKPISRIHFAVAANPGDQLHAFIALAAWLFQKGGVRFDKPSEDDDQSVLLTNIVAQAKKLVSIANMFQRYLCLRKSLKF
jgi:estrogen-related receptor beta like 1